MQQSFVISDWCKPKLQEFAEAYEALKRSYRTNTRPYHSTQSVAWTVVQPQTGVTPPQAMAVAKAGQTLNWFTYGIGQVISLSGAAQFRTTPAETNLTKALETNNDDFAIQWIGAYARGNKVAYAANPFADTDASVISAMSGQTAIYDPFSYRLPAEAGSPATLEMLMFHALAPYIDVRLEWDNGMPTEKIGTLDQFTQGGGASYLHSNGEPSTEARLVIPEGYGWTRAGQAGSQLAVYGVLTQDVVVPISLSAIPGGAALAPSFLYTELVMRLGGVHFLALNSN